MSNDKQKTYDAQTAKFLAVLCENMPRLTAEWMQQWIERPKQLRQMLTSALSNPCFETHHYLVADKEARYDGNAQKLPIPIETIRCAGPNPFTVVGADVALTFGVEYKRYENHDRLELRPWLVICSKDIRHWWNINLRANEYMRGHEKMAFHFDNDLVSALLEQNHSFPQLLWELEINYVDAALQYIRKNHSVRLSVEPQESGWIIYLHILKDQAALYTVTFSFNQKELYEEMREAGLEVPATRT